MYVLYLIQCKHQIIIYTIVVEQWGYPGMKTRHPDVNTQMEQYDSTNWILQDQSTELKNKQKQVLE